MGRDEMVWTVMKICLVFELVWLVLSIHRPFSRLVDFYAYLTKCTGQTLFLTLLICNGSKLRAIYRSDSFRFNLGCRYFKVQPYLIR